jgi:hypothetical protein
LRNDKQKDSTTFSAVRALQQSNERKAIQIKSKEKLKILEDETSRAQAGIAWASVVGGCEP